MTVRDSHALLDELLAEAVARATGDTSARPREGQTQLAHDVLDAMLGEAGSELRTRGQVAGAASTGSGKSFAYGAPAALMAVLHGERTIVSTESLSLQAQVVDKDMPTLAAAAKQVLGSAPSYAVLKGWSNYACTARAVATAHEVTGIESENLEALLEAVAAKIAEQPAAMFGPGGRLLPRARTVGARTPGETPANPVVVDGQTIDGDELHSLLSWALSEVRGAVDGGAASAAHPADRHSYPGVTRDDSWRTVSITPAECPGQDVCPFGATCRPAAARERAAQADIVITNHSMLAVQTANDVPVVLGSRRLGTFRHLVVDEAHTLPSQVRSQGARSISAFRVAQIARLMDRHWGGTGATMPPWASALREHGSGLADLLDQRLTEIAESRKRGEQAVKQTAIDTPLHGVADQLTDWLKAVKARLSQLSTNSVNEMVKLRRSQAQVESLLADVVSANSHVNGVARWVEPGDAALGRRRGGSQAWTGASLKTSPVDVASPLRNNLYTVNVLPAQSDHDDGRQGETADGLHEWQVPAAEWCDPGRPHEDIPPRYEMSVTAVSATLPNGYGRDAGMRVGIRDYPSPFGEAYAGSLLYVPRAADQADVDALSVRSNWVRNRPKFDTARHPEWAKHLIARLAIANSGSALVLTATSAAGRLYTGYLRSLRPEFAVHSQWDGPAVRQLVAQWREDHGSVLIGTKSLMTGTDAPGATCTLVIVDRVPRAAGNPVDDARVEALMERQDIDRWTADRYVYVSDAALLLEQASGRLIRGASDRGVVAVLDPRLLKTGTFSYQAASRKMLTEALHHFEHKIADLDVVLDYLAAHVATEAAGAA